MPTVALLGLAAVFLVVVGLLLLRRSETDPLTERIEQYAAREEPVSMEEIELSLPISDRIVVPILRRLSDLVVRLTPQSMLDRTAHNLELAGSPGNITAAEFWIIRGVVTVVLGVLFFFFLGRYGQDPGRRVLYSFVADRKSVV